MIRPVTLLAALLFVGSGLYLYQTKHQAQLFDREIRRVREAAATTRERAAVLRADYALLNDPDRLKELAAAYLPALVPTQPTQWSSLAEMARRLPPVGQPEGPPAPLEAAAAPSEDDGGDLPLPPPFAPPPVATPTPPTHASVPVQAIALTPRPLPVTAPARAALLPQSAVVTREPAAPPVRMAPRTAVAAATYPLPRVAPPTATTPLAHGGAAAPAALPVGSSLGMARALPGVMPIGNASPPDAAR